MSGQIKYLVHSGGGKKKGRKQKMGTGISLHALKKCLFKMEEMIIRGSEGQVFFILAFILFCYLFGVYQS